MDKVRCIGAMHITHCNKRNEILTHAAAWINTEDILLTESSQT